MSNSTTVITIGIQGPAGPGGGGAAFGDIVEVSTGDAGTPDGAYAMVQTDGVLLVNVEDPLNAPFFAYLPDTSGVAEGTLVFVGDSTGFAATNGINVFPCQDNPSDVIIGTVENQVSFLADWQGIIFMYVGSNRWMPLASFNWSAFNFT